MVKEKIELKSVFKGIDNANPLGMGERLANGIRLRIGRIDPALLARKNTACGDLLIWLVEMVMLWNEREDDLKLLADVTLPGDSGAKAAQTGEGKVDDGQIELKKSMEAPPEVANDKPVKEQGAIKPSEAVAEVEAEAGAQRAGKRWQHSSTASPRSARSRSARGSA